MKSASRDRCYERVEDWQFGEIEIQRFAIIGYTYQTARTTQRMMKYFFYGDSRFLMTLRRVEIGSGSRTGQTQDLPGRPGTDRPFSKRMAGQAELKAVTVDYRLPLEYAVRFYCQLAISGWRAAVHCSHFEFPTHAHRSFPQHHPLRGVVLPRPGMRDLLLPKTTPDDRRHGAELATAVTQRQLNWSRQSSRRYPKVLALEM